MSETRFKPLDVGGEGLTGSLDADGCLVALNTYHPAHGYITLTAAAPFPEAERYNPAAVRDYRAGLARLRGMGFRLAEGAHAQPQITHQHIDTPYPRVQIETPEGALASDTGAHEGCLYQRIVTEGADPVWSGRLALMRCAYTQLTEGGPVAAPALHMHLRFVGGRLLIDAPTLPAAVIIDGFPDGPAWEITADAPVEVQIAGRRGETVLRYAFGMSVAEIESRLTPPRTPSWTALRRAWSAKFASLPAEYAADRVVRRGLGYSLLMAVPCSAPSTTPPTTPTPAPLAANDGVCLLTDHMLLPLSWNRDAYYVARALLAWPGNQAEGHDLVRRHLRWMFEQTERRDGFWGRCYLANGKIKDAAFQLDQQLFPFLELTDYALETGDQRLLTEYQPHLHRLMERLMALRIGERMLFPTDETPADDPIALPYHFSSHVLLWRVWQQLKRVGMPGAWDSLATRLRHEIEQSFVGHMAGTERTTERRLYAYATDGAGRYHWYHDANDLPVALGPAWGFCAADDPVWQATMRFAFSDLNVGGAYGRRLGSVHTRAPWPLGDIQEWIVARAGRDAERALHIQQRLQEVALWDGALPEAYHLDTGEVASRTWFAWPTAAYACVALGALTS
jgi:hypothetical protein